MQKTNNIIRWCQNDCKKDKDQRLAETEVYSVLGNRKSQQDFAGVAEKKGQILAIIADGMGGMQGGERASSLAVQTMLQDYQNTEVLEEQVSGFLKQEALLADRLVSELKGIDDQYLKAGTTMVAIMITKTAMQWISIGDSRIYLLRKEQLIQLTRDHNYRECLIDRLKEKKITEETYAREMKSKKADALTSYLGIGGLKQIDLSKSPFSLQEGDQILLCSDGIYKSLTNRQIEAMLVDNQIDVWVSVKRLVKMAWQQATKKQDNATAILISYH